METKIEKFQRGYDEMIVTKYYEEDGLLGSVEVEVIYDKYLEPLWC